MMNKFSCALTTANTCLDDYYSLITSYLGPNKSCKFVGEEGSKTMVCCTVDFIRHLSCSCCFCRNDTTLSCNFKHPINRVVSSCIQSHHSAYGCGSATLLSMFYFWHRALLNLNNEGINIGKIILILVELLENTIGLLDSITIPFNSKAEDCFLEMLPEARISLYNNAVSRQEVNPQSAETVTVFSNATFPSRSRHFMKDKVEKPTVNAAHIPLENLPSFNQLVSSLGHDNKFSTKLLAKAWSIQINDRKTRYPHSREIWRFDVSQITTLAVNSIPSNSKAVHGILLPASQENIEILANSQTQNIRTLLINGNITPTFVHKGVNLPKNLNNLIKPYPGHDEIASKKSSWMSETLNVLKKQLDVAMILATGQVDKDIATHLNLYKICTLSNISVEVLNAVANSTGASMATYVTDCDELNVATCVSASIECTYNITGHNHAPSKSYIILNLASIFQTIVICHPVAEYLSCLEHSFWHAAHRLAHATAADKVLPGGCITEESIMRSLQVDSGQDTEYLLAKKVITEGFQDFINVVKVKLSWGRSSACFQDAGGDVIFDDYVSKIESWRSALRLACLVSQTDFMIITGDLEKCIDKLSDSNSGLGQL